MSAWNAHPACPPDVRVRIERAVRALPAGYLNPPYGGEVFESAEACLRRLQGFALEQGLRSSKGQREFVIEETSDSVQVCTPWEGTRNFRQLEDHTKRDTEGVITT
jgi:hypothetical protein